MSREMKIRHIPDSVESNQVETILSVRKRQSEPVTQDESEQEAPSHPRVPRITRLMALAIKFQGMIERGEIRDYADIARLGQVTRARVTQIMNLLLLAPDLQEILLFSFAAVQERHLREVSKVVEWREQRKYFTRALRRLEPESGLTES